MFAPPLQAAALLADFGPAWFFAGGWALDLFLEHETRPHDDLEIAIFRRDQRALQDFLKDWELKKAIGGKLLDWKRDEFLELPVHAIHCFNHTGKLQFLEVLLNETDGETWIYRRDARIRRPLSRLFLSTEAGLKFLSPEIVLLYKSKNPRPKDERDFLAAVDRMSPASKDWLRHALTICDGKHVWIERLR